MDVVVAHEAWLAARAELRHRNAVFHDNLAFVGFPAIRLLHNACLEAEEAEDLARIRYQAALRDAAT